MFCTYIWIDLKKNKPVYVGKGLPGRPFIHKRAKSRLGNLLRKREIEGNECSLIKIDAATDSDACEMEMLLIAMIGREDLGLGPLFNLTDGGDGLQRLVITEEHRKNISKGKTGKPQTEESKRINRERYNKPGMREFQSQRRSQPCTVDGVIIYKSVGDLVKALGVGPHGRKSPSFRFIPK